jgi:hypothetical protein
MSGDVNTENCVFCAVRPEPLLQFSFIYMFCIDLGTNRDCFPYSINWWIFKTPSVCVYCAARPEPVLQFGFIYMFCIDLGTNRDCIPYSINWWIFKTLLSGCVYFAVRTELVIIQLYVFCMDLGTNRDCFPYSINLLIFKALSIVFTVRYGLSL